VHKGRSEGEINGVVALGYWVLFRGDSRVVQRCPDVQVCCQGRRSACVTKISPVPDYTAQIPRSSIVLDAL